MAVEEADEPMKRESVARSVFQPHHQAQQQQEEDGVEGRVHTVVTEGQEDQRSTPRPQLTWRAK